MAESSQNDQQCSFGIKKIVDCKIGEGGKQMYKVKWEATWEPAENLSSCQHLIDQFWAFVNKAKLNEGTAEQQRKRMRMDPSSQNNGISFGPQHMLSEDSKEDVQRLIARTNATQPGNMMTPSGMLNTQQNQMGMPRTPTRQQPQSPFAQQSPNHFQQQQFNSPQQQQQGFSSPSQSPSVRGKAPGFGKSASSTSIKSEEDAVTKTPTSRNATTPSASASGNNPFDNWDNPYVIVRFHCRVCDKELPNKNYWKTHHGLHSNSYKCQVCGRSFGTSSNLKRHEKIHQNEGGGAGVKKEEQKPTSMIKIEQHSATGVSPSFIKQESAAFYWGQQQRL